MLGFPTTLASSSGARSQPQSTASRSSTQALRFFLQGTPTSGFPFSSLVVHDRLMHLFCPLCMRSCSLFPCFLELPWSSYPPLWCCSGHHSLIAFSVNPHHCPLGFELLSPLTTCCDLVALTFTRLLCLLIQPIRPCPVCTTGPLWLLAITVSLLGTSPSWPTSLVHSLAFLSMLRLWTLSLTPSRGPSLAVLRITLVVAPGPAHAQGSLSGGMMRATTLWLLATAHGVTFAVPGLLRIRLVSASSVNSFTAQFVPPGPASGTSGLVL